MGDPKKGTPEYDSKLEANNKRRNAVSLKSTLQKPLVKAFVRKVLTRVRKNKDHEYEGMLIRSNNHMLENVGLKKKLAIEIARTTRVRAVVTKVDEKYKRPQQISRNPQGNQRMLKKTEAEPKKNISKAKEHLNNPKEHQSNTKENQSRTKDTLSNITEHLSKTEGSNSTTKENISTAKENLSKPKGPKQNQITFKQHQRNLS